MSALDEVRAMMIFARVVEEGGFSAAARKMGLSRAATVVIAGSGIGQAKCPRAAPAITTVAAPSRLKPKPRANALKNSVMSRWAKYR